MSNSIFDSNSIFARKQQEVYAHRYHGRLRVSSIAGGIPSDPKVAEGWLRSKLGESKDDEIRRMVAEVMVERDLAGKPVDREEAARIVNMNQHLNGFKRVRCSDCPPVGPYCVVNKHQLAYEGRTLKAAMKEAASIAMAAGNLERSGWAKIPQKGLLSFLAEHVFVVELLLPLEDGETGEPVYEPSDIAQRFIHTFRGSGIQYEEVVHNAAFDCTIVSDMDIDYDSWAALWVTGEKQGVGASRSQGYGTYEVVKWEREDVGAGRQLKEAKPSPKKATAKKAAAEATEE
jgi:hypothetical protein